MSLVTVIQNQYNQAGLALFPCKPHDHSPAHNGWQKTPINSDIGDSQIYGVILTPDVFVIDYDPRNDDAEGNQWRQFTQRFGLPETFTVQSGGGGFHFYYRKPPDWLMRGKAPHYPAIDIKMFGGYSVGAGSMHRNGKPYAVLRGSPLTISPCSNEILEYLHKELTEINCNPGTVDDGEANQARYRGWILSGGHNKGLYEICCMGHDYGLSPMTIKTIVLDICNPQWDNPATEAQVETRIDHAFQYAQNAHGCRNTEKADFENIREIYGNRRSKTKTTYLFKQWDQLKGAVLCTLNNVLNYFLMDELPNYAPGGNPLIDLIRYNSFAENIEFQRPAPWHKDNEEPVQFWRDMDTVLFEVWLAQNTVLKNFSTATIDKAVAAIAYDLSYNPLKDYLLEIIWDGVPRVATFLSVYCNAADWDYTREISRIFLLGAVARGLKPGTKHDTMIVFESSQGKFKSTAAEVLGGEWYSTTPLDPRNKDTYCNILNNWFVEIAELDGLSKADVSAVKTFLSTREDNIRLPYARRSQKLKRRCTFIGTMNPDGNGYLKDPTGNRRFHPVHVGTINIPLLKKDRDQLFAEAVYRVQSGENHWTEDQRLKVIIEQQQISRVQSDAWNEIISDWLNRVYAKDFAGHVVLNNRNIAQYCLEIPKAKIDRGISARISLVMRGLGYAEIQHRQGINRGERYWSPAWMEGI